MAPGLLSVQSPIWMYIVGQVIHARLISHSELLLCYCHMLRSLTHKHKTHEVIRDAAKDVEPHQPFDIKFQDVLTYEPSKTPPPYLWQTLPHIVSSTHSVHIQYIHIMTHPAQNRRLFMKPNGNDVIRCFTRQRTDMLSVSLTVCNSNHVLCIDAGSSEEKSNGLLWPGHLSGWL